MDKPDILLFISDQHSPYFSGWYGNNVYTPNLDQLCSEGVRFDEAYTPCPLCVPARMAMLSGQRASRTGIFTNNDALPNTTPTFLHSLVAAGYETVLIGRMHFVGEDQRHGFTHRIAPDFTSSGWVRPPWVIDDFGVHTQTMGYKWCTHVVGGGTSPVLCYDEMVARAAQQYLSVPHKKPQFIVVGTYGPHFPYVAPPALFLKYLKQFGSNFPTDGLKSPLNPVIDSLREPAFNKDVALACQAAYAGLVEYTDTLVGEVRSAWNNFTKLKGAQQVFGYLSDHGDTVGEHGLFGKKTFFERSAKVPFIFAGDSIAKNQISTAPVSLLDLGPTMCSLADANPLPKTDGESLADILQGSAGNTNRWVYSESMDKNPDGDWTYGAMIRKGKYKYISYPRYAKQDMLFDIEKDPHETHNLANEETDVVCSLRGHMQTLADPANAEALQAQHAANAQLFVQYEKAVGYDDRERYRDYPPNAKIEPEICVTGLSTNPGFNQTFQFYGLPKT
ncbi:MAG: sulfatase-like hydrolase/transferase [Oscillospiraceae bacterium]